MGKQDPSVPQPHIPTAEHSGPHSSILSRLTAVGTRARAGRGSTDFWAIHYFTPGQMPAARAGCILKSTYTVLDSKLYGSVLPREKSLQLGVVSIQTFLFINFSASVLTGGWEHFPTHHSHGFWLLMLGWMRTRREELHVWLFADILSWSEQQLTGKCRRI